MVRPGGDGKRPSPGPGGDSGKQSNPDRRHRPQGGAPFPGRKKDAAAAAETLPPPPRRRRRRRSPVQGRYGPPRRKRRHAFATAHGTAQRSAVRRLGYLSSPAAERPRSAGRAANGLLISRYTSVAVVGCHWLPTSGMTLVRCLLAVCGRRYGCS